eukprot:6202828-Pleurochrysis_carterae.AAC.1
MPVVPADAASMPVPAVGPRAPAPGRRRAWDVGAPSPAAPATALHALESTFAETTVHIITAVRPCIPIEPVGSRNLGSCLSN